MSAQAAQRITQAAQRLIDGGLVAFPTETVYGLGADAGNQAAVAAIYSVKGRPPNHPLIVHVASWAAVPYWFDDTGVVAKRAALLAQTFWPGPLTLIVPRRAQAPAWACGGQSSIGLRCPSHPLAQDLLRQFEALGGCGVAAPSANRFGRISPTTASHVRDELGEQELMIIDGGAAQVGLESTIIDLTREQPVLLRPGAITPEQIELLLGEAVLLSSNLTDTDKIDTQAPRVSGALASHYAPGTPLQLQTSDGFAARLAQLQAAGQRAVCLRLSDDSDAPEPREYARHLYARLRELDRANADVILAELPPASADWAAVRDRLLRARSR